MTTVIVSRRRFWKPFPLLATSAPLAISWSLGHLSLRSGGRSLIDTMLISFPCRSSLFTSHLNLNETATNSTVPWGLWALPTSLEDFSLPTLPNVSNVPGIGRRKRQASQDSTSLPDLPSFESDPPHSLLDDKPLRHFSNLRTRVPATNEESGQRKKGKGAADRFLQSQRNVT